MQKIAIEHTWTNAYHKIAPMFWGERIALDDACDTIRAWIQEQNWQ